MFRNKARGTLVGILAPLFPLLLGATYSCSSSTNDSNGAKGGGQPAGSDCSAGSDCTSGICRDGACTSSSTDGPDGGDTGNGQGGSGSGQGGSNGAGAESPGAAGSNGTPGGGAPGTAGSPGTGPSGSACTAGTDCASGLCVSGTCSAPGVVPGGGTTTTGPQWHGTGNGFRPLTAGCGPNTAADCTGACEQAGGDQNVDVIRPPATLCFASPDDPTTDDPAVVIEQSIETLNGVTYVHLRVTFDPSFVDNTYGENSAADWHLRGGPHIYGHTFDPDLVKSDHTELLLTDGGGATVTNVHVDYVSPDTSASCGFASLGVSGGDGAVTDGDPSKIIAVTTSLARNLNGCGYCENAACGSTGDCTEHSPSTDATYTTNSEAPNWDFRMVYELWIDASAFGDAGFGQAYMTYVHASPNKSTLVTLDVTPSPCPPTWDKPYCPPGVTNCFGTPPGSGGASGAGGAGTAGSPGTGATTGAGGTPGAGGTGGGIPRPCPVNYQIYVSTEGQSTCTPIPFANYPGMTPCPDGYHIDLLSEGQYCLPNP